MLYAHHLHVICTSSAALQKAYWLPCFKNPLTPQGDWVCIVPIIYDQIYRMSLLICCPLLLEKNQIHTERQISLKYYSTKPMCFQPVYLVSFRRNHHPPNQEWLTLILRYTRVLNECLCLILELIYHPKHRILVLCK